MFPYRHLTILTFLLLLSYGISDEIEEKTKILTTLIDPTNKTIHPILITFLNDEVYILTNTLHYYRGPENTTIRDNYSVKIYLNPQLLKDISDTDIYKMACPQVHCNEIRSKVTILKDEIPKADYYFGVESCENHMPVLKKFYRNSMAYTDTFVPYHNRGLFLIYQESKAPRDFLYLVCSRQT